MYDAAGNLVKDEDGYSMRYDADNQLDLAYFDLDASGTYNSGDTPVAEYKYDALGRRIEFKNHFDGSGIYGQGPTVVTTRYVHDGQNVIAEYDDASPTPVRQRYYVHGTSYIDERAVLHDEAAGANADYYYILKDLYTVVGLSNKQGREVERYTYDAYGKTQVTAVLVEDVYPDAVVNATDRSVIVSGFGFTLCSPNGGPHKDLNADGNIDPIDRSIVVGRWTMGDGGTGLNLNQTIPASAVGNPYGFTGRSVDAYLDAQGAGTGGRHLYHYRARYYDPEHGRFLQRDPAEYLDAISLYEYAGSSPTTFVDFLGLGQYRIGTRPPDSPKPDPGSGPHGAKGPPADADRSTWWKWWWKSVGAHIKGYTNASKHMVHYLENTGTEYIVDVEGMVKGVGIVDLSPEARAHFFKEINDAMEFVEAQQDRRSFAIVGTWTNAYNKKSKDWYYAVGGYSAYGSAKVDVLANCEFEMEFGYHFDDWYNWDQSKSAYVGGELVPDAELGRLHQVGIAREFHMKGNAGQTVRWKKGQRFDVGQGLLRAPSGDSSR